MYKKYFKRMLDILLSIAVLVVLSPVLLILFIIVRVNLGSPTLFKQRRVGENEKKFCMLKFRTMTNEMDNQGELMPDEQRLTKLGRILRSTSLDELPELFNIIKGDLSIVGPRSLPVEYLPYYSDYERQRHLAKGGLIPPEVLHENIMPTWQEQFEYEVDYVNNISFYLDIKVVASTFKGLLKRNASNYGSYVRKTLVEERKNETMSCRG